MNNTPTGRVLTITLEDQGIPTDIANHRRSPHADTRCAYQTQLERWDDKNGRMKTIVAKPCRSTAAALSGDGRSFCLNHRGEGRH